MKKFLATIVSSFTPYKVSISENNITNSRAEKKGYDIDTVSTCTCTLVLGNWEWTKTPKLTGYLKRVDNVKGGLKSQTSISFKW